MRSDGCSNLIRSLTARHSDLRKTLDRWLHFGGGDFALLELLLLALGVGHFSFRRDKIISNE
jgi:hypothetical protein